MRFVEGFGNVGQDAASSSSMAHADHDWEREQCLGCCSADKERCQRKTGLRADVLQSGPQLGNSRARAAVGFVEGLVDMGQEAGG